mgnify:CR=1 FL=1
MMKNKFSLLIYFLFVTASELLAYDDISSKAYWVYFTDKQGVNFNPYIYFHQNTIERRLNAGIALNDITDFPLNNDYVKTISTLCDSVTIESRWMNAVKIWG